MVKFKSIKIINFGLIEEAHVEFTPGIHRIVGINNDNSKAVSNGAGKSTLLEAIVWDLYGETIRGLKSDSVIKPGAKWCGVELVIVDNDGKEVVSSRYRNHPEHANSHIVTIDGESVTQHKKADTTKELAKIIGADFDIFTSVTMLSELRVMELTDAPLKSLLERMLGLDAFSFAYKKALQQRDALERNRQRIDTELTKRQAKFESHRDRLEELLATAQKHTEQTDVFKKTLELRRIGKSTDLAQCIELRKSYIITDISLLEAEIKSLDTHLVEARVVLTTNKNICTECKVRATKLSKLEGVCTECGSVLSPEHIEEEVNKNAARELDASNKVRGVEVAIADLTKAKTVAQQSIASARADELAIIRADNRISELNKEIREIDKELSTLTQHSDVYIDLLTEEENKMDLALSAVNETQNELGVIEEDLKYMEFWVAGYSPKGIPSYVMDLVVPKLNTAIQQELSSISDGFSIDFSTQTKVKGGKEVRDKFSLSVVTEHGEIGFKAASSGEKARLGIAGALGFRQLQTMTGGSTNLLAIDEALDRVDTPEWIMNRLQQYADSGMCVLLISHNPDLLPTIEPSIIVERTNGISTIRRV